jgi:hypothetical protein
MSGEWSGLSGLEVDKGDTSLATSFVSIPERRDRLDLDQPAWPRQPRNDDERSGWWMRDVFVGGVLCTASIMGFRFLCG